MKKILIVILSVIAVLVFVVLGIEYFSHAANQLPHWLPGYDPAETKVHTKHGLAAIVLALGAAAFGWFQSGPKPSDQDSAKQ